MTQGNKQTRIATIGILTLFLILSPTSAMASYHGDEEGPVSVPLRWTAGLEHGQPVEDSEVTVTTTEEELTLTAVTQGLHVGHAYTVWLMLWTAPERCVWQPNLDDDTLQCGFSDLVNAEGKVLWGDGAVADEDGSASFELSRVAEECWDDPEQVAFPGVTNQEPCLPADTSVPEYQLVVRDHGPYDPEDYGDSQLTTLEGGCDDYTCRDSQNTGAGNQNVIRCFPPAPSLDCLEGWT